MTTRTLVFSGSGRPPQMAVPAAQRCQAPGILPISWSLHSRCLQVSSSLSWLWHEFAGTTHSILTGLMRGVGGDMMTPKSTKQGGFEWKKIFWAPFLLPVRSGCWEGVEEGRDTYSPMSISLSGMCGLLDWWTVEPYLKSYFLVWTYPFLWHAYLWKYSPILWYTCIYENVISRLNIFQVIYIWERYCLRCSPA